MKKKKEFGVHLIKPLFLHDVFINLFPSSLFPFPFFLVFFLIFYILLIPLARHVWCSGSHRLLSIFVHSSNRISQ